MKLPPMRTFVNEDRYVRAKHTTIYPSAEQLEGVQNMVSNMECGLKAVSEWLNKKENEAAGEGEGYVCVSQRHGHLRHLKEIICFTADGDGVIFSCLLFYAVILHRINCVAF